MAVVGVGQKPVHTKAEYDEAAKAFKVEEGVPLQVLGPSGEIRAVVVGAGKRAGR
jgi:hypothetical protein